MCVRVITSVINLVGHVHGPCPIGMGCRPPTIDPRSTQVLVGCEYLHTQCVTMLTCMHIMITQRVITVHSMCMFRSFHGIPPKLVIPGQTLTPRTYG